MLKNFGIKGIKFKTNKMNGKSAMKKLKEIDPALDVNVPLVKPIKYNSKDPKMRTHLNQEFLYRKEIFYFFFKFSIIYFL